MKKYLLALSVIFILLSSIPAGLAQSDLDDAFEEGARGIFTFIFGDDFPDEWLTFGGFVQLIVLPFIALFAVMYGILSELNLFKRTQSTRLVIACAFSLGAGKWALGTMKGWMVVNTWFATMGFGIMLLLGIIFWAAGGIFRSWFDVKGIYNKGGKKFVKEMKDREKDEKRLRELQAREKLLWWRYNSVSGKDDSMAQKVIQEYEEVQDEMREIAERIYKKIEEGPAAAGPR